MFLQQANVFRQFPFSGLPLFPYGQSASLSSFPNSTRSHDPPCNTLFVGNLPNNVTERELSILFRFMPGFCGVRLIQRENKPPICFVEFTDSTSAAYAMHNFQGIKLDRDCLPLSIEFDRGSKHDREKERSERGTSRERNERSERDRERESERERDKEKERPPRR